MVSTEDFHVGMRVAYIPSHAKGRLGHPSIEHGIVSSINREFVFVRFENQKHAKACMPFQLVITE